MTSCSCSYYKDAEVIQCNCQQQTYVAHSTYIYAIWTDAGSDGIKESKKYPCIWDLPTLLFFLRRAGFAPSAQQVQDGEGNPTLWPYQLPSTWENGYSQSHCFSLPDPTCSLWVTEHEIIAKEASKGPWKTLHTHIHSLNDKMVSTARL